MASAVAVPTHNFFDGDRHLINMTARGESTRVKPTPANTNTSPLRQGIVEKGVRIKLYRNGDKFYTGKTVVLPKGTRDLDHMMHFLSTKIKNRDLAPLRRLYTPEDGKRIKKLSDVKHGGTYVVAGKESFKSLGYLDIASPKAKERMYAQRKSISPQRPLLRKRATAGRIGDALSNSKPKVIFLIRNCDERNETVQMLISNRNATSLDQLYQRVSEKLKMEAPCRAIYTVSGRQIESVSQFEHFGTFIAVGRIPFKQVGYKAADKPERLMKKEKLPHIKKGKRKTLLSVYGMIPQDGGPSVMGHIPGKNSQRPSQQQGVEESDKPQNEQHPTTRKSVQVDTRERVVYEFEIRTGDWEECGTTDDIFVTLHGSNGSSEKTRIANNNELHQGSTWAVDLRLANVDEVQGLTVELNQNNSKPVDNWFVEKISVILKSKKLGGHPKHHFFGADYRGIWLGQPGGTFVATAHAVEADNADDAKAEIALLRKIEMIGFDPRVIHGAIEEYSTISNRIELLCHDGRALKRLWRKLDPEQLGMTGCERLWKFISEAYPPLHLPPMLQIVYSHVYGVKRVSGPLSPAKSGFRAYLLSLAYACELFEAVNFPRKVEDYKITQDQLQELSKQLPISLSVSDIEKEFFKLRRGDGLATLSETIRWYCKLRCPSDLSVVMSKHKKSKSKKRSTSPNNQQRNSSIISVVSPISPEIDNMQSPPPVSDSSMMKPAKPTLDASDKALTSGVQEASEVLKNNRPDTSEAKSDANELTDVSKTLVQPQDNCGDDESKCEDQGQKPVSETSWTSSTGEADSDIPIPSSTLESDKHVPIAEQRDTLSSDEKRIKRLESDPDAVAALWQKACGSAIDTTCSLHQVRGLLNADFPQVGSQQNALTRAYKQICIVEGEDMAQIVTDSSKVHRRDFFSLITQAIYFVIFFTHVPGMRDNEDLRLEFGDFSNLLKKLQKSKLAQVAAGEFDAMDSNEDGRVLADEICTWYALNEHPNM